LVVNFLMAASLLTAYDLAFFRLRCRPDDRSVRIPRTLLLTPQFLINRIDDVDATKLSLRNTLSGQHNHGDTTAGGEGATLEETSASWISGRVGGVPRGKLDYAVAAIENTLAGSLHENYDLLLKYRLPIIAETAVRIAHNLIAPKGVSLHSIRKVYSMPIAHRQCLRYLAKHRSWEVIPYYDTAGSVKMLMEQKVRDGAAIASKVAAERYGAKILASDIGDEKENYTRFFLLARRAVKHPISAATKTSIVFATRNIPGALFRCLSVFALRDISLAKIESRPLRERPFEYLFYLDFLGNPASTVARNALKNLEEITEFVRVLGCYPQVP